MAPDTGLIFEFPEFLRDGILWLTNHIATGYKHFHFGSAVTTSAALKFGESPLVCRVYSVDALSPAVAFDYINTSAHYEPLSLHSSVFSLSKKFLFPFLSSKGMLGEEY